MCQRAFEGYEKALYPDHPDTLTSINNLVSVLHKQGKDEGTEEMHRRALEGFEKVVGPEHPLTPWNVINFGNVLHNPGKLVEAEVMHRQVLESLEKALGSEHALTLLSVSDLLIQQGKHEGTVDLYRRATYEVELCSDWNLY